MEARCSLCGKTVKELAEDELRERSDINAINISVRDGLGYPYSLCSGCEDFLMTVIPSILVELGVIRFDEKAEKYVLVK